jgi:hypothetical protein
VVLIGASNVAYAFPRLAEGLLVRRGCDVFAAHGHGRSLGMRSTVFSRELPGVLECGLWPALESHIRSHGEATGPRVALVTAIGNDLLYQVSLQQVIAWLDECLERLASLGFETVVATLPMSSVMSMSALRFTVARNLLFPDCPMNWDDMRTSSTDLDTSVRKTAESRGLEVIVPLGKWYKVDPIHIRQSRQRRAFQTMCGSWKSIDPVLFGKFPWDRAHYWWNKRPYLRWVRRSVRIQPQPVWQGPRGNVLRMY